MISRQDMTEIEFTSTSLNDTKYNHSATQDGAFSGLAKAHAGPSIPKDLARLPWKDDTGDGAANGGMMDADDAKTPTAAARASSRTTGGTGISILLSAPRRTILRSPTADDPPGERRLAAAGSTAQTFTFTNGDYTGCTLAVGMM